LDQKIALNNQINAELEAMAKTLYDYWFVQFDFPDENGKPYKSSGGKMVYNDQLKREIPEGWGVETLSDQISFDKTGDWGKESSEGNYIVAVNCIRGTDINELKKNGILNSPKRYILKKNTHKLLDSYDIVIEISGGSPTQSTGRVGKITEYLFNRFENPIICSNFCKAIQLREKSMFYYFVAIWQSYYDSGTLFGWEGKTSGIKNLQFDSFTENTFIPLPEKKILEEFFYIGDELEIKIQNNLKQNQELT
ncbi:TPA: restriction endonuclease subunit S, partial [Streptococcus suis]